MLKKLTLKSIQKGSVYQRRFPEPGEIVLNRDRMNGAYAFDTDTVVFYTDLYDKTEKPARIVLDEAVGVVTAITGTPKFITLTTKLKKFDFKGVVETWDKTVYENTYNIIKCYQDPDNASYRIVEVATGAFTKVYYYVTQTLDQIVTAATT